MGLRLAARHSGFRSSGYGFGFGAVGVLVVVLVFRVWGWVVVLVFGSGRLSVYSAGKLQVLGLWV